MFSFKSVGHFFASAVHDSKVWLSGHQSQIDAGLRAGATVISAVDPALAPLAMQLERASEAALGQVLAVVSTVSDASAAQGLNLQLDQSAIAEFKALIAAIEKIKPGTVATAESLHATLATAKPA
jgi:hypothetical protein